MDPLGQKLLDAAKPELGYTEKADGYTKFGDWYSKNVDNDSSMRTAPWCDMFLAWAANKAGIRDWVGEFAYTPDHAKWFQKHDAWGHTPEPGALVFFSWSGSKSIDGIDHVGIVEKVDGRTLHTIDANADGMYLKRKLRDVGDVVGYGYPSKVKVAGKSPPDTEQKYVPQHAAPAPSAGSVIKDAPQTTHTSGKTTPTAHESPVATPEAAVAGLLAVVLLGTFALAVGKSTAVKIPAVPAVRVRKRGKHHRTPTPVALPADVTPYDLVAAEAGTDVMPAITAAVAAEAEDREFWGRIAHLKEDQELAFWDSLHDVVSQSMPVDSPVGR